MEDCTTGTSKHHSWLDHLAIGMATVCAIHCLLTPLLVIALPIIATSFFVHEDFHLWMMLLVLPTTSFAIFMGCRKHKDRWVAGLSALGLSVLILALANERIQHLEQSNGSLVQHEQSSLGQGACASCSSCSRDLSEEPIPMEAGVWFNVFGGLLLASAHFRNFRLCRKKCDHG